MQMFFLKRLLSYPHFQLLTSHCPSSLSSSSVYFRFPSLLRNASTKWGFPRKKKKPTKKKSTLLQERREFTAGDHVSKVKNEIRSCGPPRRRKKLDCPRTPCSPFSDEMSLTRVPAAPTQKAIIFEESHLDI